MKTPKWILSCSLGLITATALAQQDQNTTPAQPSQGQNEASQTSQSSSQSRQFFRSKDLVGANVKDSQGQKAGDIKEIVINPKTGEAFAAIDVSHGRDVIVPFQALTVR